MRLAFFSPLSPRRSGISDYSEELLPHLASGAQIDLFVDGFKPANTSVRERFQWFDYRANPAVLNRLGDYDAIVYHMGNDHRHHQGIYETARAFPGIVVLHDFALQNFFIGLSREGGDMSLYLDELEACHGAQVRADSEAMLERGAFSLSPTDTLRYPLNYRIARNAEAIIVHSEWSQSRLSTIAPAVPVARINLHVLPGDEISPPLLSHEAKPRRVEIASFGHITTEKGIERTLRILAGLRQNYDFHYTLVGQPDGFDVSEMVRSSGLTDRVTVTGYVSLDEFKRRMKTTDIAINLRERTVGETSASVCRVMAAGVPPVVSNVGWFAELPDDAAIKIDVGENADALLRAYLIKLMEDSSLRQRIGENARRYVQEAHAIEKSAQGYLNFIRETVAQRVRRRFVRRVSAELALLDIKPTNEKWLRGVATAIARLTPTELFVAKD